MRSRSLIRAFVVGLLAACASGWGGVPPRKIAGSAPVDLPLKAGTEVTVIAPSASTSERAQKILHERGWIESKPYGFAPKAPSILVVVRSSLLNPLSGRYEDTRALR